jgi:integrase
MKHNIKITPERYRKDKKGILIIQNVPIFAFITFGGMRYNYFIGFRIDIDKFDYETELIKKNNTGKEGKRLVQYNIINKRIKKIKAALILHFEDKTKTTKEEVKKILDEVCNKGEKIKKEPSNNDFLPMFSDYINNEVSNNSKKNVTTVFNNWKRYAEKRKYTLTFDFITNKILKDFEVYLKNESTNLKGGKLVRAPKSVNTINRIMKATRAFWNYAKKELIEKDIIIKYPFELYKLPKEIYGTPIYISKDERNILFNAIVPNERLMRVRDVFVFQCLIGARVADMCKLTKSNIQNNNLYYIQSKTKDTKEEIETLKVPLNKMAINILSRYDLPGGSLLPFISDQRYNIYLKELFEFVGLTRMVTRLNPLTQNEEQVRLCDIATSHMARRTFIGNLYANKEDRITIGSMSGHKEDSKSFKRYVKAEDSLKKDAVDNM